LERQERERKMDQVIEEKDGRGKGGKE